MPIRDVWVEFPDTYIDDGHTASSSSTFVAVEGVEGEDELLTVNIKTSDGIVAIDRRELESAIAFAAGNLVARRRG